MSRIILAAGADTKYMYCDRAQKYFESAVKYYQANYVINPNKF